MKKKEIQLVFDDNLSFRFELTLLMGAHTQCTSTASADFCTSASATISPSDAPNIKLMPAADGSSGNSIRSQNTTATFGITQQMANTSKTDRTVSALEEKLLVHLKVIKC